ncbi:MAG: hypothetical protein WAW37_16715 [Syntrophobacteraceae bacterium]
MKYIVGVLCCAALFAFLFSTSIAVAAAPAPAAAAQDETIVGTVVQSGKNFVIEADDGDYIAKGKDLSKMVGKLVEVTGKITESDKGDVIEVKNVEEIQE